MIEPDPKLAKLVARNGVPGREKEELHRPGCEDKALVGVLLNNRDSEAQQVTVEGTGACHIRDREDDMVETRRVHEATPCIRRRRWCIASSAPCRHNDQVIGTAHTADSRRKV